MRSSGQCWSLLTNWMALIQGEISRFSWQLIGGLFCTTFQLSSAMSSGIIRAPFYIIGNEKCIICKLLIFSKTVKDIHDPHS